MAKAALSAPSTEDYARFAREAKATGKVNRTKLPKPRMSSAMPRAIYFDLPIPREGGGVYLLTPHDVGRLRSIEARNRLRVKKAKGPWPDAIVEPVDFIAVCIRQDWLCCICKKLMDPALKGNKAISVEHDPALSVCNEHSERTIHAAHVICNVNKAHKADTPRAAKIKRVDQDEARHKLRMENKAKLSREVFKRERRAEAKLVSRSTFPTQRPLLSLPQSMKPDKAVNGFKWAKTKWPKGRKFRSSTRAKPAQ